MHICREILPLRGKAVHSYAQGDSKGKNEVSILKKFIWLLAALVIILGFAGCNRAEEPKKIQAYQEPASAAAPLTPGVTPAAGKQANDIVAEVDGSKMTRAQLEMELTKKMAPMTGKVPPDRLAQVNATVRKQIIDDFVMRTLLLNELNRLKISSTEKEIAAAMEMMKGALPAGATLDDVMKKSGLTRGQLQEEIAMGIRINKLVASQQDVKVPPTDKEIEAFYKKNKDKFQIPESVHVRHILVAGKAGEDEKAKAGHRQKAENLRQQLLAGKDFAELARDNSDCPSKSRGGDLGTFTRGQMVKPFETAAFNQKVNEIGSIVATEYGYHIIQVLDHHQARTQPLDKDAKNQIAGFLKEKKKYDAFNRLMNQLKAKAHIVVTDIS